MFATTQLYKFESIELIFFFEKLILGDLKLIEALLLAFAIAHSSLSIPAIKRKPRTWANILNIHEPHTTSRKEFLGIACW